MSKSQSNQLRLMEMCQICEETDSNPTPTPSDTTERDDIQLANADEDTRDTAQSCLEGRDSSVVNYNIADLPGVLTDIEEGDVVDIPINKIVLAKVHARALRVFVSKQTDSKVFE